LLEGREEATMVGTERLEPDGVRHRRDVAGDDEVFVVTKG
jgi:hypothetical protein